LAKIDFGGNVVFGPSILTYDLELINLLHAFGAKALDNIVVANWQIKKSLF